MASERAAPHDAEAQVSKDAIRQGIDARLTEDASWHETWASTGSPKAPPPHEAGARARADAARYDAETGGQKPTTWHETCAKAAEPTPPRGESAQNNAARPQTGAKTAGTRAARSNAIRAGKTAVAAPLSSSRPLLLFAPEPLSGAATSSTPPRRFRWRRMELAATRAIGPERIAPEWWLDEPAWRSGLRDYWQVETADGRRLWLYHTPQNPGWFAQGEFA